MEKVIVAQTADQKTDLYEEQKISQGVKKEISVTGMNNENVAATLGCVTTDFHQWFV